MPTIWDILSTYTNYEGKTDAHAKVLHDLKANGYKYDDKTAWCVLQIMAVFAKHKSMAMIGGIHQQSKHVKAAFKKVTSMIPAGAEFV